MAGAIFHGDAIDSYFYDNHADYVGGACQQTYCINCTFRGNVADGLYDFALKGGGIILCKFDGDTHDARLIKDIKFYPNSQYSVSQGDFVYIHETGVEITGLRERDESMDGFFMTIVEAYQDGVLKATNYFEFGRPFWKVALPAGDYKCVLRVGDYKSDFISVHVDPTIKILASDITTTYGGEGMEVTITDFLGNPLKHKSCTVQVDNNPSFWVSTDENGKFTIGPEDLEPFGNLIGSHDITINLYSFDDGSVSLSKTVKMVINKADVKLKVNLEKDSYYTYENITFNIDAIHPKAKGTLSFSINGLTYNFTDVEIKNLIFPFQDFLKAHMTTL